MQFDYSGQVVLITGAAGGFGRVAARSLHVRARSSYYAISMQKSSRR